MAKVDVSDHAVLRFLERTDGPHPVDARGRILTEKVREAILANGRGAAFAAGAKSVSLAGVQFVTQISGNGTVVVTTVKDGDYNRPKQPHPSNGRKPKNGRARKLFRRERE